MQSGSQQLNAAHCRKMKTWMVSRKPQVKLLTEDEYREQADAETVCALEELRRTCRGPDFPSWLAVSRLQAPKKFADFVLGGNHVSPEEMSLHEEQYGLGGAFLEEQLFNLPTPRHPPELDFVPDQAGPSGTTCLEHSASRESC